MIPRQKWTEHVFNLESEPTWTANIRSRVQDTVIRLAHHCQNLTDEELSQKLNGKWSIKEHIGHLIVLDELHFQRLREFKAFKTQLSAADMSNAKTHEADYNKKSVEELLADFQKDRENFISHFDSLSMENHQLEAFHPRLKVMMKPVSMLFFVAEHDDHHVTSILEIKRNLAKSEENENI